MNTYQQNLYSDLMALTKESDAFFFQDHELDGVTYRTFNYRLASYTEFQRPNAFNARGTMFQVENEQAVRLASLPMEKFFNLNENPFTMDLDLSNIKAFYTKADGSLITTFFDHTGKLRVKSKGSLFSEQAVDAQKFIDDVENAHFAAELRSLERSFDYTVIMEWVAPHNRIVLNYDEPKLIVLGIRHRNSGRMVEKEEIDEVAFSRILEAWADDHRTHDTAEFVKQIPDMVDIEGYVALLENGQRVKIKTLWYLSLHRAKDSINSPRRLYEIVLADASDDLRVLFHDDIVALDMITEMEKYVHELHNRLANTVESYYDTNKHLDRKDYAIKGREELNGIEFSLAMNKYGGKSVDYKETMLAKWKHFGIKDDVVEVE